MIDIGKEGNAFASWPTHERLLALKRIIPRARVEEVLARTGQDRSFCSRLPGWFMVWFVIALGLFCCGDCYRPGLPLAATVSPWRNPRAIDLLRHQRLGIAPLRFLANQVASVSKVSQTAPRQFYPRHAAMALDGFVDQMSPIPQPTEQCVRPPRKQRCLAAFPPGPRLVALCKPAARCGIS